MRSKIGDKQRLQLMKGMRNIIVHEYFGIDNVRIWQTVKNDIPKLLLNLKTALKEFE